MIIANAAELIARGCPGWVVDSIECLGEGNFCIAYLVNDEWVFRFAKHEKAAASLRREACLLPLIADQFDTRIPRPQPMSADDALVFIRYPMLPGPALTRERYLRLPEPDRERCASQVASFLMRMHRTDVALAGLCGVEVADYAAQYGGLLARARQHLFVKLGEPERVFVEQATTLYLESQTPSAFKPVLLHGDLSPDHVLYDERAACVTGIIDFSDMVIGDPAYDLVFIYEDYGLDFLSRFLRGYVPDELNPTLERMYHFYLLGAIEWAVESAEQTSAELDEAVAQLGRLRMSREQEFQELLSACGAA